jgi:hypothetical protein
MKFYLIIYLILYSATAISQITPKDTLQNVRNKKIEPNAKTNRLKQNSANTEKVKPIQKDTIQKTKTEGSKPKKFKKVDNE